MDRKRSFRPLLLAGAVALASTLVVLPAQAERDGPHHGPDPERRLEHMTARLGLEDDQVALVRDVLEDSQARAREILAGERQARRDAMAALREDTDARLAGILTPAQMELLAEGREARREQRGAQRDARREAGFERLVERLDLAESQIEPVRDILEGGMARGRALMEQAREDEVPREALREQFEALRAETARELEAVLTPEQMETFLAFREERGGRGAPRRRGGPGRR